MRERTNQDRSNQRGISGFEPIRRKVGDKQARAAHSKLLTVAELAENRTKRESKGTNRSRQGTW
jgi:hypothetical protein